MLGGRARGGLWVGAGRRGDSHVWFAEGGFDGRSARSTAAMSSQPGQGGAKAPMINTALAYVYAPLRPLLQRLNITREGRRLASVRDVLLPEGFVVEVVATDFNAPVQATFGPDGACYVSEAGYQIDTAPRVLRVDVATGAVTTFFELPEERWSRDGAFTGGCWLDGHFYFANNDRISRVLGDGSIEDVVTGLPWGDHMPSYPIVGPDGRFYFTTGSATNCGVVGADNYTYGWLRHFHSFCDVPGQDVTLVGTNSSSRTSSATSGRRCGAVPS